MPVYKPLKGCSLYIRLTAEVFVFVTGVAAFEAVRAKKIPR
ncbi:hypothetical protein Niako_1952 [Niastella koreensis GR20-10]|uniref:Uncharacterized protein n=1 Tax=Niastella koreensis (strain DSM 17620 / KACC 11465 / NBRC 106392 / GR20-10) TaxID=700598 RepID=G8TD76_NIAKG|nr:hypothetical protein Niako_1952 [Niastella koreensis GR20-10]